VSECYFMPTDNQFKDDLRKELIYNKELLEYLEHQDYERLRKKIAVTIERIEQSLQD